MPRADTFERAKARHAAGGRPRIKPWHCERCGQLHERCAGHADIYDNGDYKTGNKIGIRPCKHWPMHGQTICQTHGGKGRNRAVAERQWRKEREVVKEMSRAERAIKTFGLPVETTPQQALLDEIARTAGHVKWLGDMIGNLDPDEATWGRTLEEHTEGTGEMATEDTPGIDLTKTVRAARPAVWYQLYQQERAHLVHVAKVAIQCNISERQIQMAEEQGHMIATVLRNVIESPELELSVTQVQIARTISSKVLRSLSINKSNGTPAFSVVKELPGHNGA
jgi:hypothetical protein